MLDDLRHALRRLRSHAGTSAIAVGMLMLAVGLTTAMFTLMDALLFRPAPFRDPQSLVELDVVYEHGAHHVVPPAVLRAWQASGIFDAVDAVTTGTSLLEGASGLVAKPSAVVGTGVFEMLGVRPIRGRAFAPDEGRAGSDDRVMLSEDVWRSVFGGDPDLVGKRIKIDGAMATVIGIMPAGFRFPAWDTVIWMPIDYQAPPPARALRQPWPYARLPHDVPRADVFRVATDLARQADPTMRADQRIDGVPLAGVRVDRYYRRAMPYLVGGVVLVFLVLCTNVSSLLLAQYAARRREFGVCSALGASRGRLLRQALVEHTVLGVCGALGGILLAWALVSICRSVLPQAFLLRTLNPMAIDARALLAASISGLAAIFAAGVLPAWIGTRAESAESLRLAERVETPSRAARLATNTLLVTEIALACTLLVGATLLARSFVNLVRADRGLDTRDVTTAWISLPRGQFPDRPSRLTATAALESSMRSLPGVTHVALSYGLPPDGGAIHFGDDWHADTPGAPILKMDVQSYNVGPEFFALYGIPILRGRVFQPGDADTEVVVSERFAAALWPGIDPIGRTFTYEKDAYHVIGLAREINHPSLNPIYDLPEFYQPLTVGSMYVMMSIRCGGACPDGAVMRQALLSAVSRAEIVHLGPLETAYDQDVAPPRAAATLTSAFAIIAMLTAAGGLFSVLSFAVGLRRREFGIRVVLGAAPASIRNMVLGDGIRVAVAGFAIGGLASWALGRALVALEYGVTANDPLSWMLVTALVATTVLAAAWLPARRAMRVDPGNLLRE